jgi:predicted transcriptional regulator
MSSYNLGHTKKRILIVLYNYPHTGYKTMSRITGVGLDTVRSHVKSGKYSKSLLSLGLIERTDNGWELTEEGYKQINLIKDDPKLKGFLYK